MENREKSRSGLYWLFIALIVAFACLAGSYAQFQLPPLQDQVQENAGLTPSQYAQVFSAPMLPGLCLSLVAGVLIDRFGYRKMIALALIVSTLAAAGRTFCGNYFPFWIAMALTGVAPTFIQANNAKIMSNYVPNEKLSLSLGVVMMGGAMASFIGSATTHLFPSTTAAYVFSGLLGLVATALWIICIRKKSTDSAAQPQADGVSVLSALKTVIRSKNVWRIGLCMFFVESFYMSVASTAPSALKSLGYDPATAGLLTSVLSIGSPMGNLIGGPLAIRSGKPKLVLMIVAGVTAICFPLLWASESIVLCALAFFLSGFCFGTGMISIASMPILAPEIGQRYAGTAGGLINTMEMAGGFAVSSYVIAPLANGDFHLQFLLATGALALGFLAMFLIPTLNFPARKKH